MDLEIALSELIAYLNWLFGEIFEFLTEIGLA